MTRPFDKLRTQQLVVECSDPGLVVSLTEEFEHVLRQVDFARARALHDQLSTLARELGPEFERAWRGFRLEMPNDGGSHPPAFGNRETADTADEERLKGLLAQAEERNIGRFKVRSTLLLPQHGPLPETREQYVCDLADTVRGATWDELGIFQSPVPLPKAMAAHRERLMEQHGVPLLRARARFPTAGHVWTRDSLKALEGMLREVNTRAEAVMEYELACLQPADVEPGERIRWAALSARLGKELEKWYAAVEEPLPYLYQRVALAWLLWTEGRGWGPIRPFLEHRLDAYVEQAGSIYTDDGVDALRLVYDGLRRPPWWRTDELPAATEKEEESPDESVPVDG